MIRLEMCHPNDFLKNKWILVETLSDDANVQEFLEAPSFVCAQGTIVRAGLAKIWIFNKDRFIDVSGNSATTSEAWNYGQRGDECSLYAVNRSFPEMWYRCRISPWVMHAIRYKISEKRQVEVLLACEQQIRPWSYRDDRLDNEYTSYLKDIDDYRNNRITKSELKLKLSRLDSEFLGYYSYGNHRHRHMLHSVKCIGKILTEGNAWFVSYGGNAIESLVHALAVDHPGKNRSEYCSPFHRIIHRMIPFSEVAENM